MLIQSLKRHFPARFPEWMNSGVMATWGIYMILHPDIFTNPTTAQMFAGMSEMTWGLGYPPSSLWGVTALLVGLIRGGALFINGAYTRTPMIRLAASFLSAFIWAQVVIAFVKTGVPNTGLVVYSWLVIADLASAYRAGCDVVYAEHQRRLGAHLETGSRVRDRSRVAA